jgi:hypothetical protein
MVTAARSNVILFTLISRNMSLSCFLFKIDSVGMVDLKVGETSLTSVELSSAVVGFDVHQRGDLACVVSEHYLDMVHVGDDTLSMGQRLVCFCLRAFDINLLFRIKLNESPSSVCFKPTESSYTVLVGDMLGRIHIW